MSQTWHSLFIPGDAPIPVIDTLRSVLTLHAYQSYDPFPGGTGTPPGLTGTVRLFVVPPQAGWVCVMGEFPEALLPELQQALERPLIAGWLTGDAGSFAFYQDGAKHDTPGAFTGFLRPDASPETLEQAWAGNLPVDAVQGDSPPVAVVGADALPPELQELAEEKGVDPKKASKLFERLSGNLFGKLGKQAGEDVSPDQAEARAMFAGGEQDIWNSLHGQRVRAIASVLNLPANWRVPDWDTVRDSYQVHRLRERSPRMPLMPGDSEALKAVPNALEYVPIYMGHQ